MKMQFKAVCAVAALAIAGWSSTAAFAQQKTTKQCGDEWRADKAAMQKAGTTEKAYVEKCRAGTASAAPAATPAPAAPAPKPAAAEPAAKPAAAAAPPPAAAAPAPTPPPAAQPT